MSLKGYLDPTQVNDSRTVIANLQQEYKKLAGLEIGVEIRGRAAAIRPSQYQVKDRNGALFMVPAERQAYRDGEIPFSRWQMREAGIGISEREFYKLARAVNQLHYLRRTPREALEANEKLENLKGHLRKAQSLVPLYDKWEREIDAAYWIDLPQIKRRVAARLPDFKIVGKIAEDYVYDNLLWQGPSPQKADISLVPVSGRKVNGRCARIKGFNEAGIKIMKVKKGHFYENVVMAKVAELEINKREREVLGERETELAGLFLPNMELTLSDRIPLCNGLKLITHISQPSFDTYGTYYFDYGGSSQTPQQIEGERTRQAEHEAQMRQMDNMFAGVVVGGIILGPLAFLAGWLMK
jgi:hypothetical protein